MLSRKTFLAIAFTIVGIAPLLFASQCSAAEERRPGVRYTSGTYVIKGWEKQLVGGNSNLAHWNWSPMVGYTQSVASVSTGKQAHEAPMPEQRSHYVKPIHVALPFVHVTPHVEAPMPVKKKLVAPPVIAPAAPATVPADTPVLSYGSYSSYNGFSTHTLVHGTLAHKDGTAQLVHSGRRGG